MSTSFQGAPKVDLLWTVWPPAPPKLRRVHFFTPERPFLGVVLGQEEFTGETVDFRLLHAIHILKAMHLRLKMKYLGAMLVDPVRRQIAHMAIRFYNIWDCVICDVIVIAKTLLWWWLRWWLYRLTWVSCDRDLQTNPLSNCNQVKMRNLEQTCVW